MGLMKVSKSFLIDCGSLVLIDAILGNKGGLRPPSSRFSSDPEEAVRGLPMLEALDFDAVRPAHGEDGLTDGKEKLA